MAFVGRRKHKDLASGRKGGRKGKVVIRVSMNVRPMLSHTYLRDLISEALAPGDQRTWEAHGTQGGSYHAGIAPSIFVCITFRIACNCTFSHQLVLSLVWAIRLPIRLPVTLTLPPPELITPPVSPPTASPASTHKPNLFGDASLLLCRST